MLPRPFILHRKFLAERQRIEKLYGDVELVALPDRIFAASTVESALLLARTPRPPAPAIISLRSTDVADRDRTAFLTTGRTTSERHLERVVDDSSSGELWLAPLQALWRYLNPVPRLSDYFTIHRGLEWESSQGDAWSSAPRPGYRRGLHNARKARQFKLQEPVFLDCRQERLRRRAIDLPWDQPKLVVNAARLSVTSWRIAAMLDRGGLPVLAAVLWIVATYKSQRRAASDLRRYPEWTDCKCVSGDPLAHKGYSYLSRQADPGATVVVTSCRRIGHRVRRGSERVRIDGSHKTTHGRTLDTDRRCSASRL